MFSTLAWDRRKEVGACAATKRKASRTTFITINETAVIRQSFRFSKVFSAHLAVLFREFVAGRSNRKI